MKRIKCMVLLRSWSESLLLFKPENFKLFLLVTLKSAVESYKLLFYHFWWLMLLIFMFDIGCYYPDTMLIGTVWLWADLLLRWSLFFVTAVLLRPSVGVKDLSCVTKKLYSHMFGFIILSIFYHMTILLFMPALIFTILFYLDSFGFPDELLQSFWKAALLFVFNFPFCFLSTVMIAILWELSNSMFGILGEYLFFAMIPIVISYFKSFYVKRVYEQFNIYFVN